MWLVGNNKPVDIYLGSRALLITRGEQCLCQLKVDRFEEALDALRIWQGGAERSKVRVWLSGGLCRPFVLPDVSGAKDLAELTAIARSIAATQTGLEGECEVWLDLPNTLLHRLWSALGLDSIKPLWRGQGHSMVGVAVQSQILLALSATLSADIDAADKTVIASIRPWWADALRHVLKQGGKPKALAVQDCDALTILVGNQPSAAGKQPPGFLSATTFSPVFDPLSVEAVLKRWLFSTDLAQTDVMQTRLNLESSNLAAEPWVGGGS